MKKSLLPRASVLTFVSALCLNSCTEQESARGSNLSSSTTSPAVYRGGEVKWKKHIIQEPIRPNLSTANAHDWDRDDHPDVLAPMRRRMVLYKGPGWEQTEVYDYADNTLGRKFRGGCIHSCLLDVDGDGDLDYIGSNNLVFWLECPDEPFKQQWKWHLIDGEISGPHCVTVADINGDGKMELVANTGFSEDNTEPDSICWYEIPKNVKEVSSWTRNVFAKGDAPGGSHYMGCGDVNGDGRIDIACGAKGGDAFPGGEWFAWWEQPEDPRDVWKKHMLAEKQVGATNILPGDLNGDGTMDFIATRGHGKGILWFKGPEMEMIEIDKDIDSPHSLSMADFDNDGDLDAVTCGREVTGEVAWYENDGKANFRKHVVDRFQSSYDTRFVDMDKDGDLDILIAGQFSKTIVWYENQSQTETTVKP